MKNSRRTKQIKNLMVIMFAMLGLLLIQTSNTEAYEANKMNIELLKEKDNQIMELENQISELNKKKEELNNVVKSEINERESYYVVNEDVIVYEEANKSSKVIGHYLQGMIISSMSADDKFIQVIGNGYIDKSKTTHVVKQVTKSNIISEKEFKKIRNIKPDYNVACTGVSGLSKEDIEYLLDGYPAQDFAEEILLIEKNNNVNAFLTMSIAKQETCLGTTGTGVSKYNMFGLTGESGYFNFRAKGQTRGDSIIKFGDVMERLYINKGRTTVASIHAIYTPEPSWGNAVSNNLAYFKNKIDNKK